MALVSQWPFDGDDGTDIVGPNGCTKAGTVTSVADCPVAGQANSANFAGAGRYAKTSPTLSLNGAAFSVGGWAKWLALNAGWPAVFAEDTDSNYAGWQIRSGNVGCRSESSGSAIGLNSTVPVVLDTWYFSVFTYDGASTSAMYINGVDVGTGTESGANTGTAPNIVFGSRDTAGVAAFTGRIAQWRLWDHALSPAEVLAQYQSDITAGSGGGAFGGIIGDGAF